jgi:UDP-N-acetylmuramoyl-tripeptide--D-alanyl-D-alanine ligase
MKELGPSGMDYHKQIASHPFMSKVDCIHTIGPLMEHLHDSLPREKRGFHFKNSIDVVPLLGTILEGGDCLLTKASLSIGIKVISEAISSLQSPE